MENKEDIIIHHQLIIESLLEELCDNFIKERDKKQCPICGKKFNIFLPYEAVKKDVLCPYCDSFHRHRLVYLVLTQKLNIFGRKLKFLHFAPEPVFANIFSNRDNLDYLPVDLNPSPYIKEQVDIQNIPYDDNSFDLIYCSHVLEHVPDDIQAMKEIYRVLKSGSGTAVIMVPLNTNPGSTTLDKKEYNTPELRAKHYGDSLHLRWYGMDFPNKLAICGFDVEMYRIWDIASEEEIKKYGLLACDIVFVCKKH